MRIELNKKLKQGTLKVLHVNDDGFGQAVVETDQNTGFVDWKGMRDAIYDILEKTEKQRFAIQSVESSEFGNRLFVNIETFAFSEIVETWEYFLGGVITNPPRAY